MIICTDPREKRPLTFKKFFVTVVRGRYENGYSIPGHENNVAVLRWSLKNATSIHAGFERRCKRIAKIPEAAVVFENWQDTPDDVRLEHVACMARCSIPCHFAEDSETFIFTFLSSYLRRTAR